MVCQNRYKLFVQPFKNEIGVLNITKIDFLKIFQENRNLMMKVFYFLYKLFTLIFLYSECKTLFYSCINQIWFKK